MPPAVQGCRSARLSTAIFPSRIQASLIEHQRPYRSCKQNNWRGQQGGSRTRYISPLKPTNLITVLRQTLGGQGRKAGEAGTSTLAEASVAVPVLHLAHQSKPLARTSKSL